MHRNKQTDAEVKGPSVEGGAIVEEKSPERGRDSELPRQVNTELERRRGREEIVNLLRQD